MQAIGEFLGAILAPIGTIFQYVFYQPVFNILMVIYEGLNHIFPAGAFPLAIIAITLMIRSALIPLTRRQLQSTRKMQLIQPQLKELQQRYRGDPQMLMAEQRRLYKDNGVSMYGGCLPLLVQMPFLYALYGAFRTVIEHAGDVTALNKDLYPFLPHLSQFPQTQFLWTDLLKADPIHILPILAALLTFTQLRMAMPVRKPRQPGENPDPTSQATATTMYIMPLVTLFIGWTFQSGLALYWCISTGFSVAQQFFINGRNFGSLFLGIPGLEHLVPPPRELPSTVTRTPATASAISGGGSARALVGSSAPSAPATGAQEGGLRGFWRNLKESMTAAQSQAMERAEQLRQEREAAQAEARDRAESNGTAKGSALPTTRRQRPSREAPTLLKPASPSTDSNNTGDSIDTAIQQGTDTSTLPERRMANGSSASNGSNGNNGSKVTTTGNSSTPASNGKSGPAKKGTNGTRPATSANASRNKYNGAKGGSSGARARNGRPKGGR